MLAETIISRPVMKGFKAMLREQRLFAEAAVEGGVDDQPYRDG